VDDNDFISKEEIENDYKEQCMIENHSAGDFDDEFEEKD
jgi:hypothetical protein